MPAELGDFTAPDRLRHLVSLVTENGKNNHRFENFALLNSSKWILEGRFPRECTRYFGYPSSNPLYVLIFAESNIMSPHLHVRTPSSGHDSELLEHGLKTALKEMQPALMKHGRMVLDADTIVRDTFFKLQRDGAPFETMNSSTLYPFYMNEESKREIVESDFTAPKGYDISTINVLNECKFIHGMWPFGAFSPDVTTRLRLENFPSVCVRDSQGQLVSWEMVGPLGAMNHLFTLEQHRGKGLGGLTENRLSQILVREGLQVYKNVVDTNVNVIRSTLKHPLWSQWKWKPLEDDDNLEGTEMKWSITSFRYTGDGEFVIKI